MRTLTSKRTFWTGTLAVFLATMLALSIAGPAVAAIGTGPDINYDSDKSSDAYIQEDTLTINQHDRADMSLGPEKIQYYNDEGNIETLPAHYNDSQDTPVSVRYDRIADDDLKQFPRVDGESENSYTWLNTSDYTTSSGSSSSMTVNDADGNTASGVDAVNFDASVASTETASATYADGVNISSDMDKRFVTMFFNVNELTTDSVVEVRIEDSDGDYKAIEINGSASASDAHVAANGTGNGYVVQQRLADLSMQGSGDGTWDEIQSVTVHVSESNADVTVTGMDVERKTDFDLGTTMADTDGDGEDEKYEFSEINGHNVDSGYVGLTSLDSMGSPFDDASLREMQVHDVRYSETDRPDDPDIIDDEEDWDVNFTNADDYAYERKVTKDIRLVVPAAIDLSHGNLELKMQQGLVDERYVDVEYATDTGSTTFGNLSDSDTTDAESSFTTKGEAVTLASGVNAGENVIISSEILLQQEDEDELRSDSSGGAAAPASGGSGGGLWGAITSIPGMLITAAGGLLTWSWFRGRGN